METGTVETDEDTETSRGPSGVFDGTIKTGLVLETGA